MYGDHLGWMGMGIGMWLFWLLFIVIIVVIVKFVIGNGASNASEESPMKLLKARYARGEINDEEFQQRKHELEK
tara:strand:- start:9401 stop:9622 length:222 start_codon:yes stop_codon:yes gene_type:complete